MVQGTRPQWQVLDGYQGQWMKFVPDAWLSGIFGYDVIRVALEKDESPDPRIIFPSVSLPQRAFYYTKVPVTSVRQAGALTRAGFHVIDVNVTFEREAVQAVVTNDSILVRDLQAGDEQAVLEIAGTAFIYSRFHLDPFITNEVANKIKREWIANYIRHQRGDRLLVAEVNGYPAGFLALLVSGNGEKIGVIDLIGVAKNMQGRGVGKRLVDYHIQDAFQKYACLSVGTQIANVPSMRLYTKCGYDISNSNYVLHAHVNEGRII
jgi:dTDP-4-amino-4,6-dideoxy-D-galactose acyltransferase